MNSLALKPSRAVVAIGGNALLTPSQTGHPEELRASADRVAGALVPLLVDGWQVLVVHGNGPQVGIELIRSEEASTKVPPFGLDLCVAATQGSIGALLETALRNTIQSEALDTEVATVLSLVEVAPDDPAFKSPTKPIGLFYSAYRAQQLEPELSARGWGLVEDSGRGWRPVVPSPTPSRVLANPAVQTLLDAGFLVIAGGGGGVPMQRHAGGQLSSLEAVIDKDLTAAQVWIATGADLAIFLTGVPWVELNFGTPFSKRIASMSPAEAAHYLENGQFPAGSMGPKVTAACAFAEAGGTSLITSAAALGDALRGLTGTRIVAGEQERS